ncbi:MAG: hypothetical protein NT069_09155 [Planctomycetota bacterium]|nr:hypothetical protein [Planctomycetota bacterium]
MGSSDSQTSPAKVQPTSHGMNIRQHKYKYPPPGVSSSVHVRHLGRWFENCYNLNLENTLRMTQRSWRHTFVLFLVAKNGSSAGGWPRLLGIGNLTLDHTATDEPVVATIGEVVCDERLGGLLKSYRRAA